MSLASELPAAARSAEHVNIAARAPVVPPDRLIWRPKIIGSVLIFDVAAIVGAGAATYGARSGATPGEMLFPLVSMAAVTGGALSVLLLRWSYTIAALSSPWRQAANISLALMVSLGCLVVYGAYFDDNMETLRRWAVEWLLSATILGVASRIFVAKAIRAWTRAGRLARRTVIVGGGDTAFKLIDRLDHAGNTAIQILGLFDDRDKLRSPENVGRYHKLGRFEDLVAFCREQRIDLLIIALPPSAEERILHVLKMLWVLPIDVRIAAHETKLKLRSRAYNYIGDVPFLPVFDKPMSDWNVALKAIEDRVLAGLGLLVLSPLLALIALAIKLDSRGPVLFKQARHGFNNDTIHVYKFRSMYVDQCDAAAARLVTKGDPRVTRVGAFLRRSSLDELPQLINVAKGELSLVGPRPHAMQAKADGRIYDDVVEGYFARHRVKPGITGWAQVNGWRGETDTVEKIEQRVAYDLYYIENWSMLLDLRILLMTPFALVTTKNAY